MVVDREIKLPAKDAVPGNGNLNLDLSREDIHIGRLIQAKMDKDRYKAAWLARQLTCHRSNIYKIYRSSTIDTALLLRISQALNYNFFDHYAKWISVEMKMRKKQNVDKSATKLYKDI
jgi:hypothetical protein